jgi:hypothetical protein
MHPEDTQVLNAVLQMAANAGATAAEQRNHAREIERFARQHYPEIIADRGLTVVAVDRLREIAQHDAAIGNQRSDFDRVKEAGEWVRSRYSMTAPAPAPQPQPRASGPDAPRPIRETASRSNRPESASAPVVDPESVNRREAVARMAQSRGKAVEFGDNPMPSYIDS